MTHFKTITQEKQFDLIRDEVLCQISRMKLREGANSCPSYDYIKWYVKEYCHNSRWSGLSKTGAPSHTSYGLKHLIERAWGAANENNMVYCQNNWVKVALSDLNYEVRSEFNNDEVSLDDYLNNQVNFEWRLSKNFHN